MREGALVVLAGAPNSGKSSLFNALLGTTRAIVTDVPGTTRDALEARLDVDGIAIRLVDTAGLRDATRDTVERIGIEVAERYLGAADAVLVCGEDDARLGQAEARLAALTAAPRVRVRTKADLVSIGDEIRPPLVANGDQYVATSAVTGAGIAALAAALAGVLAALRPPDDGADALLTRERHRRAVARARDAVGACAAAWRGGVIPSPVAATHLRDAAIALEELIGAVQPDDVLDAVFRSFCVGK
jgi:tRNA modification GTPase